VLRNFVLAVVQSVLDFDQFDVFLEIKRADDFLIESSALYATTALLGGSHLAAQVIALGRNEGDGTGVITRG
jgi:hypothetical protein